MSGRDTNFYYSFLVLPAAKRTAIISVWDFCRAVDDAVDECAAVAGGGCEPAAELGRWRQELELCYGGGQPATGQGQRLQPWIEHFKLPRDAFEQVIEGVEMDLHCARYPTFEALRAYCLRVASAVGLICVEIFGYRDPATRQYAVDLGLALQLTNIIRDVRTDLARGRLYLPEEDLARCGCTEDDLRAGRVTPAVRALLEFECARAHSYYVKAAEELPSIDRRRLIAARIMGSIYLTILRKIERLDYDVFSTTVRVPRPRRALIAGATWARGMIGA